MIVQMEVDETGLVRVSDPAFHGKKIAVSVPETSEPTQETDWEAIKAIFRKADALDFPRRSHEEILRDLHELRG